MRSEELLALTPADILPSKRIDINKNYTKNKWGRTVFRTQNAKSQTLYSDT